MHLKGAGQNCRNLGVMVSPARGPKLVTTLHLRTAGGAHYDSSGSTCPCSSAFSEKSLAVSGVKRLL
jgi:hypothetical protein